MEAENLWERWWGYLINGEVPINTETSFNENEKREVEELLKSLWGGLVNAEVSPAETSVTENTENKRKDVEKLLESRWGGLFDADDVGGGDCKREDEPVKPLNPILLKTLEKDGVAQLKDLEQPQQVILYKQFPRRPVSARRDFPVGCGKKALLGMMKLDGENVIASSTKPRRKDFKDGGVGENIRPWLGLKPPPFNTKANKGIRSSRLKSVFPWKFVHGRHVRIQSLAEKYAVLGHSNCPMKQGKQSFKSKNLASKHEFPAQDISKSNSREKRKADEDYVPGNGVKDDRPLMRRSQNREMEVGVTRDKVRKTLRLFQIVCRLLLRDEEMNSKPKEVNTRRRIDLTTATILKENNKWVNTGKQILGVVPGVEVGDEFHYRVELSIIGLHHPYQGGIDYVNIGGKTLATSVVASGTYDDEMECSDVLVYSGSGGIPIYGSKTIEDQKLVRGNLALKNSMDEGTPVRVIRGFKEVKGQVTPDSRLDMPATLTYDGLYLVEKYWQQKGTYGNMVFMFQLRRIPGQTELARRELKKSKKASIREGLCVKDISQGKEKMAIGAVNTLDDEKPPPFEYITKMMHPLCYNPTPPLGCGCTNGCLSSNACSCTIKNGGQIPFNYNGAIVESRPLVYECGPKCRCPPSCYNRVSQHGIKFPLEVFKTKTRGWGVRSLRSIPSGSFVCEYTGELLQDMDAEKRTGNDEYLFDIGRSHNNDHALWEGLSNLIPSELKTSSSCEAVEDVGFTIDAAKYGNVGRFVNHSCSPNLYAQNVLYDHDDKRMPHIMLFAAENIPPLKELTYDYNYELDKVHDADGNIKKKKCYCGSLECTGRMY